MILIRILLRRLRCRAIKRARSFSLCRLDDPSYDIGGEAR